MRVFVIREATAFSTGFFGTVDVLFSIEWGRLLRHSARSSSSNFNLRKLQITCLVGACGEFYLLVGLVAITRWYFVDLYEWRVELGRLYGACVCGPLARRHCRPARKNVVALCGSPITSGLH